MKKFYDELWHRISVFIFSASLEEYLKKKSKDKNLNYIMLKLNDKGIGGRVTSCNLLNALQEKNVQVGDKLLRTTPTQIQYEKMTPKHKRL